MRTKTALAVRLVTRVTRVTRVDSPKRLYGVQTLKGKLAFRKSEIIHVWQFVSSVAQRNPVDVINLSRI